MDFHLENSGTEFGALSARAKIIEGIIQAASNSTTLGPGIKNGTYRRNLQELPWRCPAGYSHTELLGFTDPLSPPSGEEQQFRLELVLPPVRRSHTVVLMLHGGGYIAGLRNVYRDFGVLYSDCNDGQACLIVDYRYAPEHPYPAALEDAVRAWKFLIEERDYLPEEIIVAGDSAGGGLSLALAMYLRDHGMGSPKKLVLMSPWTDVTASGPSYEENYTKDILFGNAKDPVNHYSSMIYHNPYVGDHDPRTPYLSPLFGDFTDLPPMLFQVGSNEMLLSDSTAAAQKAHDAGVNVRLEVYPEMFHVFQMGLSLLPESAEAWKKVAQFIEED